jgi:uncharacterized phiE125 gp8 family phage protein
MLIRIKGPESFPVGLSEVKAHLRLDHAHEDEYLQSLIQASTGVIEEYLGRSLLTQTWRSLWEKSQSALFPLSSGERDCDICAVPLAYPPLRRIISVHRLIGQGQKAPIYRHRLEINQQIPHLIFANGLEPVEIDYETGYGDYPIDIPPVIRQSILMTLADFYEHRESAKISEKSLVREILESYRIRRLV